MSTPRKQRPKEPRSQPAPGSSAGGGGTTERLKAVVRRLPPTLPEEIFWQSVEAWVSDDTVTWKSYHPGKQRTKRTSSDREGGVPSRAYIAFKNEALVATFGRAYDGHMFRDKAGNESYVVVEYAPFQKVPTEKKKIDARNNTIDKDDDYVSFLETLKGGAKTESTSLDALVAASQPPPPPTTTPLLEALKAEKSALKDKEAILRNHAHYKEAIASLAGASASKKEEGKKKAGAGVGAGASASGAGAQAGKQLEQQPTPPSTTTKRAKKAAAIAQKASQNAHGKNQPGPATPTTPAPNAGHGPRQRPKEPHGRSHPPKGDTPIIAITTATTPATAPATGTGTADKAPPVPVPTPTPAQRKHRPVIGLGRQFEAALSGAGVAVTTGASANTSAGAGTSAGGDRKRRDKGGDGAGAAPSEGNAGKTKPVPSILQRPEGASLDAASVQSPRGTEGQGEGAGGGKGSMRRGKPRRGPGRVG